MASDPPRLEIRRRASVRDADGNVYGIIDVSPEVADPAILLGIRRAIDDELVTLPLRVGDVIDQPGVHLRVEALSTNDTASITLAPVGTDPGPA